MEVQQILEMVSNFGFPIVWVIVLFRQNSEFQKTLNDLSNTLKEMTVRLASIETKVYEEFERK